MSSFKLKRLDEGNHLIEEDCLILRGSCVIQYSDDEPPEKVEPMTFYHEHENETIRVLERTSLLVGKFPTPS